MRTKGSNGSLTVLGSHHPEGTDRVRINSLQKTLPQAIAPGTPVENLHPSLTNTVNLRRPLCCEPQLRVWGQGVSKPSSPCGEGWATPLMDPRAQKLMAAGLTRAAALLGVASGAPSSLGMNHRACFCPPDGRHCT